MATPMTPQEFADLMDPRFERIFNDEYNAHPDMIPVLYDTVPHNGRQDMSFSSVSTLEDFQQFTGSVSFQSQYQGYDSTMTFLEWVNGFQLTRKLIDDDQYQIWDDKPRALAASAFRTRQQHAARMFVNAFSVDTLFYNNSEGVALCSNSHTTTTGASTASGFDNLITSALSAVSVATARIQFAQFRGPQAEIYSSMADTLLFGTNNYEKAFEIVNSPGKLDTANNNANVHEGRYRLIEWRYLDSAPNNWFMLDSTLMKLFLKWSDRVPLEYGFAEDFPTFVAMYRAYMRYAMVWRDWRFILGAQVS